MLANSPITTDNNNKQYSDKSKFSDNFKNLITNPNNINDSGIRASDSPGSSKYSIKGGAIGLKIFIVILIIISLLIIVVVIMRRSQEDLNETDDLDDINKTNKNK